jgi:hypothetical protein
MKVMMPMEIFLSRGVPSLPYWNPSKDGYNTQFNTGYEGNGNSTAPYHMNGKRRIFTWTIKRKNW